MSDPIKHLWTWRTQGGQIALCGADVGIGTFKRARVECPDCLNWLSEHSGNDLGATNSEPVARSATAPLEGPQIFDVVRAPEHYRWHPSGVECREITREFSFNAGAAIKYIWRHQHKGKPIEDLRKAIEMLNDEIERLSRVST